MRAKTVIMALSGVLAILFLAQPSSAGMAKVKSTEFIGMPAPASVEEKTDIYTRSLSGL